MRHAVALICSALLSIALAVVCSSIPEQVTSDENGQEYAAHWVVVQFIETDPAYPPAEESWIRAAELVSGHLTSADNGSSLRRVMFLLPKDYDGLENVCDDLKMMECVYDALPDPVIEDGKGDRVSRFIHSKEAIAQNPAVASQSAPPIPQQGGIS